MNPIRIITMSPKQQQGHSCLKKNAKQINKKPDISK